MSLGTNSDVSVINVGKSAYPSKIHMSRYLTKIEVKHLPRPKLAERVIRSHSVPSQHGKEYFRVRDQKETLLKRLTDMQNSPDHRAPEEVIPQTPVPDYDDIFVSPERRRSACKFAKNFRKVIRSIHEIEDMYLDLPEPEPDYFDETEGDNPDTAHIPPPDTDQDSQKERSASQSSDDGLIQPKKLPNPCLDSSARMAVHKELLLNYKRGINVLEKPELQKTFDNRRQTQRAKEWDEQKKSMTKRTSLEMKLEQRANKMKEEDEMKTIQETDETNKPEFQMVFAKITQKSNGQVK